ncbi:flagellar hook-length control protein FliK [Photobacterium phosphoreum]|uniref:flagellar hook-length control protein FliK n=1 Tax=Photobacterium phosphoreum TaxID=659 RepID=UPI001E633C72|nr:flagellar hook-length control protein FliK [Photobacterium phosphoreum]MCD9509182.1 flagellar hook-length control protein FliK [Photobacterium phosphoreum]
MNLFNVSLAQTAKPAAAATSGGESETVSLSDNDFSQQYQQAIDDSAINAEMIGTDSEINTSHRGMTDISTSTDIPVSDSIAVNATDESLVSADSITIVDDATELMAAGNVFLQQLTQSNQQLKLNVTSDANAVNSSGNSLPPSAISLTDTVLIDGVATSSQPATSTSTTSTTSITPATAVTNSAVLASQAAMLADDSHGQNAGEESDISVNNSPLSVTTTALSSTAVTPTSEMLLNMSAADSASLLANGALAADESRLHHNMNANVNGDSLAQQLAGLSPTSPNALKPEQSAVMNNAQSPLLLTREQAGEQVHERINMMMAKNLKYVDIRLDPPELGKIQIKLSINQDQASVQFTVNNPQTRDIVEQAMPRLREMLQQQGLQLAQSSVQQESSQQFAGHQNNSSAQSQSGQQSSTVATTAEGQSMTESDQLDVSTAVFVTENKDQVDYYA